MHGVSWPEVDDRHAGDRSTVGPRFLLALVALLGACGAWIAGLAGCSREPAEREVVLYTSCDDYLLRQVAPLFEQETGVKLRLVGDTEATKTTGLVERLLSEKDRPRADVWWSNEALGTARLEAAGVLAPYTSKTEADFGGSWPASLRSEQGTWYGFGLRSRAIGFNTKRLSADAVPRRLEEFATAVWKGRFGMARPHFGTTRTHMAWFLESVGEEAYRRTLEGLKANGVRLYDGNSSVVRGIANGEIEVGLTDTDDVYAAERQGWPVAMVFEAGARGEGPLLIPNTVALVRGAPHPDEAGVLIDFLLGERVERMLAESEAGLGPIRADVRRSFPDLPGGALDLGSAEGGPRPEDLLRTVPRALQIWDEVFGS